MFVLKDFVSSQLDINLGDEAWWRCSLESIVRAPTSPMYWACCSTCLSVRVWWRLVAPKGAGLGAMCNYMASWASRVILAAPVLISRQGRGDRDGLRPGWDLVPQLRPGSAVPSRALIWGPGPEAEVKVWEGWSGPVWPVRALWTLTIPSNLL